MTLKPTILQIQDVTPGRVPIVLAERMDHVNSKGEDSEEERCLNKKYRVPEASSQTQNNDDDPLDLTSRDSEDEAREDDRRTTPGRGSSIPTKGATKSHEPTSPMSTEETQKEQSERQEG